MPSPSPAHILMDFGFTALESEIYAFLLGESPATGYRVAQAIGKPAANTYKAIQSLERKGAVLVDQGDSRQVSAIDSQKLLGRLEKEFQSKRSKAAKALEKLGRPTGDERVYQMKSRDQVIAQAIQSIEEAEKVVLLTAFPGIVSELAVALQEAAGRGIDVVLKAFAEVELTGVEVIVSGDPQELHERWPGDELHLVVDGRAYLVAIVSRETNEVVQAVWSRSPILALIHHNGLASEFCLNVLAGKIKADAGRKQLLRTLTQFRHPLATPGCADLLGVEWIASTEPSQ